MLFQFFRSEESMGHWHMQTRTGSWFANSSLQGGYKRGVPMPQCSWVPILYILMLPHLFPSLFVFCSYLLSPLSQGSFLLPTSFFLLIFMPLLILYSLLFAFAFSHVHICSVALSSKISDCKIFLPSCSQVHDTYPFLKFISLEIFYPKSC